MFFLHPTGQVMFNYICGYGQFSVKYMLIIMSTHHNYTNIIYFGFYKKDLFKKKQILKRKKYESVIRFHSIKISHRDINPTLL